MPHNQKLLEAGREVTIDTPERFRRLIRPTPAPHSLKKLGKYAGFPLRSIAVVVMDDATENVTTTYWPIALPIRFGDWNLLIEALMWARRVEEFNIFAHNSSKMGFGDDQQLIQAFFPG